MRTKLFPLLLCFSLLTALFGSAPAVPASADSYSIDCTPNALIAAINTANSNGGNNTITLAEGCTYTFSSADNWWFGPNALPPIASAITIEGNGATLVIESGVTRLRFFYIGADPAKFPSPVTTSGAPAVLTLRELTLSGGIAKGGSSYSGGGGAGMGGAIFNQGSLILDSVTLTDNLAQGGAITSLYNARGGGGLGQDASGQETAGGFGGDWDSSGYYGQGGAPGNTGSGGAFGNGGGVSSSGGQGGGFGGKGGSSYSGGGGGGDGGGGGYQGDTFKGGPGGSFGMGAYTSGIALDGGGGGVGGGGIWSSGGGFGGGGGVNSGAGGFGGGGGCSSSGGAAGGFGGGNGGFCTGSTPGGGGAGLGGAVFNLAGAINVVNSTFAGNRAAGGSGYRAGSGLGGVLFNLNGTVTITNSTLAGNTGGAVYNLGYTPRCTGPLPNGYQCANIMQTAAVTLTNSILSGNDQSCDASSTLLSSQRCDLTSYQAADPGVSLSVGVSTQASSDNIAPTIYGAVTGTPLTSDPKLASLADYGGSAYTLALGPVSPAIDAGDASLCPDKDQRGIARPQGSGCDLGAYESRGFVLAKAGGDNQRTDVSTAFAAALQLTLNEAGGNPLHIANPVTFTAPAGGASIQAPTTLNITTSASGVAAVSVTANAIPGAYTVSASAQDVSGALSFNLANLQEPDTSILTHPTGPTSNTSATFSFAGSNGVAPLTFACQLDSADWETCASPKTYTGLSSQSHTFSVRATDALDTTDLTPASFTWLVDASAPETSLTSTPDDPTSSASASFSFNASDNSGGSGMSHLECQLDSASWGACTSPAEYSSLSEGSHTFAVRAVDNVGNTDLTPASFTWLVDATAPETSLTATPDDPTSSASASFSFSASDNSGGSGVDYLECQLDSASWGTCTSPAEYSSLSEGSHTFAVRAVDNVGNTDLTPASFTWVIDRMPFKYYLPSILKN